MRIVRDVLWEMASTLPLLMLSFPAGNIKYLTGTVYLKIRFVLWQISLPRQVEKKKSRTCFMLSIDMTPISSRSPMKYP